MLAATVEGRARCAVCGVVLPQDRAASGTCGDPDCGTVQAERAKGRESKPSREEFRGWLAETEARREEETAAAEAERTPRGVTTALPLFESTLGPLPEARKAEFRRHLSSLLARVRLAAEARMADTDPGGGEPPPGPSPDRAPGGGPSPTTGPSDAQDDWRNPPFIGAAGEALSVKLCAACRGHCCQQGGTHAFLDRDRVEAVLALHPALGTGDLVETYMALIPERTFKDSCVFHGATGCGLPRELRGSACNRHFCWGARRVRDAVARGEEPSAFVGFFGPEGLVRTTGVD